MKFETHKYVFADMCKHFWGKKKETIHLLDRQILRLKEVDIVSYYIIYYHRYCVNVFFKHTYLHLKLYWLFYTTQVLRFPRFPG